MISGTAMSVALNAQRQREVGAVELTLRLPDSSVLPTASLKVAVSPAEEGIYGWISARRLKLSTFTIRAGALTGEISPLPAGRYAIGVHPFGVLREFDVSEGMSSAIEIDLTDASIVNVWFDDTSLPAPGATVGELAWNPLGGELKWNQCAVTGARSTRASPDGHWIFRALPGEYRLTVFDDGGEVIAYDDVSLGPGPNDIAIAAEKRARRLSVSISGLTLARLGEITTTGRLFLNPNGAASVAPFRSRFESVDGRFNLEMGFAVPNVALAGRHRFKVSGLDLELVDERLDVGSTVPWVQRYRVSSE